MKPLSQLVRPNILALQPYSTARDEYAGGGIDVWLDANESPYDNGVNRYPDPHQRALKALIAELKDVDAGRIFLGNGSDEAIDLAFRIFCGRGWTTPCRSPRPTGCTAWRLRRTTCRCAKCRWEPATRSRSGRCWRQPTSARS